MRQAVRFRQRAFTLIELMVVVAIIAVLLVLTAPSLRNMILMQRLRSVNAQVVTDMQFARSEAVSRGTTGRVFFKSTPAMTCYTIYVSKLDAVRCDCTLSAGSTCTDARAQEIRTVQVLRDTSVTLEIPAGNVDAFGYDHVTGGLVTIPVDTSPTPLAQAIVEPTIDTNRRLRTTIVQSGRPTVCAPNAATMQVTAC